MPGMMDTILNLGLNDKTVLALAKKTSNMRFAKDSYRRFIQMYSNVVMGIENYNFDELIDNYKLNKRSSFRYRIRRRRLGWFNKNFKKVIKEKTKKDFPQNVDEQLIRSNQCCIFILGKQKSKNL